MPLKFFTTLLNSYKARNSFLCIINILNNVFVVAGIVRNYEDR